MKIRSLTLENIGPYQGVNSLDFDLTNQNRNIILLGGKNGTGKTTIFSAIKVGIYGSKAFGYETVNTKYYDEISKLINSDIKTKQNKSASIVIKIMVDDGKQNYIYSIHRVWQVKVKGIKEACDIYKNDKLINGDELINFVSYLDGIVSADLFNLFFFDGEKIGDYFLSSESNRNFRKAFLSLCGLDSISLLVENFERVLRSSNSNSIISQSYYQQKEQIENLHVEKVKIEKKIDELQQEIIVYTDQKESLQQLYSSAGGITIITWKEVNKQLIEEESKREAIYKQLRDIALEVLPYIIVKDQLKALKNQIYLESEVHKTKILKESLNKENVIDFIHSTYGGGCEKAQKFVEGLFDMLNESTINIKMDSILNLSEEDLKKIETVIDVKSNFDVDIISRLYIDVIVSQSRTKKARKMLENSNLEKLEDFLSSMDELSQKLLALNNELDKQLLKLSSICTDIDKKEKEFEKAKKAFEQELRKLSINNIACKALLVYRETEEKLISKFAKQLEEKFIKNFSLIINKKEFIDGIKVDKKLNVRPYKNVVFLRSELKQLVNNYGKEYLIKEVGVIDECIIDNAMQDTKKEVVLPVVIKSPFSQGEKQVYIMSLYISLLQIANVNVPFVVDTPFARIDSEHRSKIIEVFFKQIHSQIFILSTDEEIVDGFKKQLDNNISNKFILESKKHGSSSIIKDRYFGE